MNKTILRISILMSGLLFSLSLASCGSSPVKPPIKSTDEAPGAADWKDSQTKDSQARRGKVSRSRVTFGESAKADVFEENIDFKGLAKSLAFAPDITQYGYFEKAFDTCSAGYGFSSTQNCRKLTMAQVQFQIVCRNSEGTISTILSDDDLRPLSGRTLSWSLAGKSGTLQLDPDGRGQIQMAYVASPKRERMKIVSTNDFLYIRAEESRRLVTPVNWCND